MGSHGLGHVRKRLLMNLENEIINDLAKNIATEMDQHILMGFMIELGWREVIVNPWIHGNLEEILDWTKLNVKGHTMHMGNRWLFEDEKDATMFTLKWG